MSATAHTVLRARLQGVVVFVAAVLVMTLLPAIGHASDMGSFRVANGDFVYLRAQPTTNSASFGRLLRGTRVQVVCQTLGETVHGINPVWSLIRRGGRYYYASDQYLSTPTKGTVAQQCASWQRPWASECGGEPVTSRTMERLAARDSGAAIAAMEDDFYRDKPLLCFRSFREFLLNFVPQLKWLGCIELAGDAPADEGFGRFLAYLRSAVNCARARS